VNPPIVFIAILFD